MINFSHSHISISRVVRCSAKDAWDLLTDTQKWHLWGPTVAGVNCEERYIRKGVEGHVQIPTRQWLRFIVTEYEHQHYWHWKVASLSATGHRLDIVDNQSCRIAFELPFLWAPYVTICWLALKRLTKLLEIGN